MSKTMIEVKDLTCDYGHGRGVFHLSFAIEQGEVFGFLGPNGAGKTTTIRQLMGFVRPDSGTVRILGMDCFADASKIQKEVGYLPGELALMEDERDWIFKDDGRNPQHEGYYQNGRTDPAVFAGCRSEDPPHEQGNQTEGWACLFFDA